MPPRKRSTVMVGDMVWYAVEDGRKDLPAIVVEVSEARPEAASLQVIRSAGAGMILRQGVIRDDFGAPGTWRPRP